jgi:3'-phosphoadenosine 5'-phosphosulfate sulfotransferase (PAPS reductase)/FAD synthetase
MVWAYITSNEVPYNRLYDQGYRSIGCAPCTRPILPSEDLLAGRWWWEEAGRKERADEATNQTAAAGLVQ